MCFWYVVVHLQLFFFFYFYLYCASATKDKITDAYRKYIGSCCEVSWIMTLNKPSLSIYPTDFWFNKNNNGQITFDEQYHERIFGSDKKCDKILYAKFPTIKREKELLSMKIHVITAEKPFEK